MAGNSIGVCRSIKQICMVAGINPKRMLYFVEEKGLPAFKIDGKGDWMALTCDLEEWLKKMRDENLNKHRRGNTHAE